MAHPWPLFQTNITIFTTNNREKCPSSIRCWDSNPQPSEPETPTITTRPGLLSLYYDEWANHPFRCYEWPNVFGGTVVSSIDIGPAGLVTNVRCSECGLRGLI